MQKSYKRAICCKPLCGALDLKICQQSINSIIIHCTHYQHSDWPRAPAYFKNSPDFADKHDYSIICYPITCADYTMCSAPLAKVREHLNGFE